MIRKKSIQFPFVRHFDDYHEIDDLRDTLRSLIGDKSVKSIEFDDRENTFFPYWGIFYIGQRPSWNEMFEMINNV